MGFIGKYTEHQGMCEPQLEVKFFRFSYFSTTSGFCWESESDSWAISLFFISIKYVHNILSCYHLDIRISHQHAVVYDVLVGEVFKLGILVFDFI